MAPPLCMLRINCTPRPLLPPGRVIPPLHASLVVLLLRPRRQVLLFVYLLALETLFPLMKHSVDEALSSGGGGGGGRHRCRGGGGADGLLLLFHLLVGGGQDMVVMMLGWGFVAVVLCGRRKE